MVRFEGLECYFNSKTAIYDAMFAQGNRQLLAWLAEQAWPTDPRAFLRLSARVFEMTLIHDIVARLCPH